MNKFYLLSFLFLLACNAKNNKNQITILKPNKNYIATPILNLKQANKLVKLPMHCLDVEYPNQLNQVITNDKDLKKPQVMHPSFYGCYDWHSSVHGHWSLIFLLKKFPNLENSNAIKKLLLNNLSKKNIEKEVSYFLEKHNTSYERTYGWAWLLKLAEELHTWDDEIAIKLEKNLQPLTDLIVKKHIEFLPKLKHPIRTGEHNNSALDLNFALDYANTVDNEELKIIVTKTAVNFYLEDVNCPLSWEPSGYDFLSPCLQEAAIMKKILPKEKFKSWFINFLPELINTDFTFPIGDVSDRTDGKLVHLDGLNFSRAWSLNEIIKDLPEYNHLKNIATKHVNHSLPNIIDDNYEGGHWLGTFAIYALDSFEE